MVSQVDNKDKLTVPAQAGFTKAIPRSSTISGQLDLIEKDILKSYQSSPVDAEALLKRSAEAAAQVLMAFYNNEIKDNPIQAIKAIVLLAKSLNALAQLTDTPQNRKSALAVIQTIINGDYDRSQIKITNSSTISIVSLFQILQFAKAKRNNFLGSDFFRSAGKYQLWLEQIDALIGLKNNDNTEALYSSIFMETGNAKFDESQSKLMACIHSKMGTYYLWIKKDDNKAERAFKKSLEFTASFKCDSWMAELGRESHFGLARVCSNKGQDDLVLKEYKTIIDSIPGACPPDQGMRAHLAKAYFELGECSASNGKPFKEISEYYDKAMSFLQQSNITALDRTLRAQIMFGVGNLYNSIHQEPDKVNFFYQQGLKSLEGLKDEFSKKLAIWIKLGIACCQINQREFGKAQASLDDIRKAANTIEAAPADISDQIDALQVQIRNVENPNQISFERRFIQEQYLNYPVNRGYELLASFKLYLSRYFELFGGYTYSALSRAVNIDKYQGKDLPGLESSAGHFVNLGGKFSVGSGGFNFRISPSFLANIFSCNQWDYLFNSTHSYLYERRSKAFSLSSINIGGESGLDYTWQIGNRSSLTLGANSGVHGLSRGGAPNALVKGQRLLLESKLKTARTDADRTALQSEIDNLNSINSNPLFSWFVQPNLGFYFAPFHTNNFSLSNLAFNIGGKAGNDPIGGTMQGFWPEYKNDNGKKTAVDFSRYALTFNLSSTLNLGETRGIRIPLSFYGEVGNYRFFGTQAGFQFFLGSIDLKLLYKFGNYSDSAVNANNHSAGLEFNF